MCAGAMTAVTTTASGIGFGQYDVVIAGGVEHMGHHPMGEGADPNPRFLADRLVDPSALVMGNTAENLHDRFPTITKDRTDAYAVNSQNKYDAAKKAGFIADTLVPVATPQFRGLGSGHRRRAAAPRNHRRRSREAQDAVPPGRTHHRR